MKTFKVKSIICIIFVMLIFSNNLIIDRHIKESQIEKTQIQTRPTQSLELKYFRYIQMPSLIENEELKNKTYEKETNVQITSVTKATLKDTYNTTELNLLYMVVEAEVTGIGYFNEKCNVASVIFNRLNAGWGSIQDILISEQFACLADGRAYEVEITEETKNACEYVFDNGDTTNGALFFDSTNRNSWASHNRTYIFTDNVGHDFYL